MQALRMAAAALLLGASTGAMAQSADRIWVGGPILTMEDEAMRAEAIAEDDGRIIAVGPRAEVMKLKGKGTEVIDLKGRALLPGFVDAHGHVFMGGVQALAANLLAAPDGDVTDIPAMIRTLKEWQSANAATVAQAKMIVGFGYDNAVLAEVRHPTKEELDQVSTEYPVIVIHQSGHLATVNSKMLELMGITAETKDPEGGVIQRKPGTTDPNGTLEETAFFPAVALVLKAAGPDGLKIFAREGAKLWARFGYTTAQEGRAAPVIAKVLAEVGAKGELPIDVAVYPDVLVDRDFIKANQSDTYAGHVRVAGAKLTIDGSPQGFTAWRDKPYYKPVGNYPEGYSGYAAANAEQVFDAVQWAAENNIQILTHSNGERASDLLIAALAGAQARFPGMKSKRPVLIHGQFLRADQMDSFKQLGVIPSLFPMHTFYWGDWYEQIIGPEKAAQISPMRSVLDLGMHATSHTDAPVALPNLMQVVWATVNRTTRKGKVLGPNEKVSAYEAMKMITIWGAEEFKEDDRKGSIAPGKLADFVILSADPVSIDPMDLNKILVLETIKEGKTVWTRK